MSDMISKLILQEKQILNLIVQYLIGTEAEDMYRTSPTEWFNGTRSDVLFTCDADPSMPPILIEVQQVVDDTFMRRLIGYCVSLEKQYSMLPIVLVFPIKSIRFEVLNRVRKQLQQPLAPFASLCLFLMRQDLSLHSSPYRSDSTMQLLYSLAQHHVGTTILNHENITDDVLRFCNNLEARLEQLSRLIQDNDDSAGVQTALEDMTVLVKSCYAKYEQESSLADAHPGPSVAADTRHEPSSHADTRPEPATVTDAHPGPSVAADTRHEPSSHADTRPESTTAADTRHEPSSHADARPEPSSHADAHPEPSSHADARPEPSSHADARPEPSSHADARPEPSSHADAHPEPSSHADARPEPATVTDAHPESEQSSLVDAHPEPSSQANWRFVDSCVNDDGPVSWNAIYRRGKLQGLFSSYSNAALESSLVTFVQYPKL
ncbi:hypothetical protein DM01DRAFT_1403177 [Hesseltinella vesiculosa]|uniref:Uncharacterized protein n=1 Tax=Hesseltinella vesiculosa TaxID=101127 RepID=A0A1X2GXG8_9FUNG|nr:hypothetical protein DM01DRAFT_1403177 [Hesseltinella vesiculosa]